MNDELIEAGRTTATRVAAQPPVPERTSAGNKPEYDAAARLAAQICSVPAAAIVFADGNRFIVRTRHGLTAKQLAQQVRLCAATVRGARPVVLRDVNADPRFQRSPDADPPELDVIFFAGYPLYDAERSCIGALAVMDTRQRELTLEQHASLQSLALMLGALMQADARRSDNEARLRRQSARFRELYESTPAMMMTVSETGRLRQVSDRWLERLGYSRDEVLGRPATTFMTATSRALVREQGVAGFLSRGVLTDAQLDFVTSRGKIVETWVTANAGRGSQGGLGWSMAVLEDITEKNRNARMLAEYQHKLRRLAVRLVDAEQNERRRIAEGLHDTTLQSLMALRLIVHQLDEMTGDAHTAEFARLHEINEEVINETRTLIFDLSPPILRHLGLVPALRWLGERMSEDDTIIFEFDVPTTDYPESELVAFLFRTVRELWINARKHGAATHIITRIRSHDGQIFVEVMDNGGGFPDDERNPQDANGSGFGLFSLRENLTLLGGELAAGNRPSGGAIVSVSVPTAAARGLAPSQ